MSNRFIPNSFQMPNAIVDEFLSKLSGNAFKCYALIARQTTGWHKQSDRISINQFMDKCGIKDRKTAFSCLKELEEILLIKTFKSKGEITEFSLNFEFDDVDFEPVPKNGTSTKNSLEPVPKNGTGGSTKNWHSTKDTIKNTIQNNSPLNPPKGEADRKRSHSAENLQAETVDLPEYVNRELWVEYCKMRKAKRAPIKTAKTLELCLKDLERLSGGDRATASAVLNQSIKNTWTGLFALKTDAMPSKQTTTKRPNQTSFADKDYGETNLPEWAKD